MPSSSQSSPAVDVVIPSYNAAPFLRRALDSVFAQTFTDFRVHVIDDGSTDDTAAVLKSFGHASEKVFLIRQPRAGVAAARNRGIGASSSRYVAFLDADDEWLPAKLERQIEFLEKYPKVGLVCSDCETVRGGESQGDYFSGRRVPSGPGRGFARLVRDCYVFTPTVMARRTCLDEVGGFKESLAVSEDFHLWLRIASRWEIAAIPEVLAIRHSRADGLSLSRPPSEYLQNGINALEDVEKICDGLTVVENRALSQAIAERYYVYGSYLLRDGKRHESRTKFSEAMRRSPMHPRAAVKRALSLLPDGASSRLLSAIGGATADRM